MTTLSGMKVEGCLGHGRNVGGCIVLNGIHLIKSIRRDQAAAMSEGVAKTGFFRHGFQMKPLVTVDQMRHSLNEIQLPGKIQTGDDVLMPSFKTLWDNYPDLEEMKKRCFNKQKNSEKSFDSYCSILMSECMTKSGIHLNRGNGSKCWSHPGSKHILKIESLVHPCGIDP